jgi:hypothetical protein
MTSYVRVDLRRLVEARANRLCEYCLIHEDDTYFGCQVEHIIAEKHGGSTDAANLAYACVFCNRAKGTDVGTITSNSGQFTRFFNPRIDRWTDHFSLHGVLIQPRTIIGEATSRILRLNDAARVFERQELQRLERYPPNEASIILNGSN